MSISDLTPGELSALVRNAASRKQAVKAGRAPTGLATALMGQTVAMMFSKRSTRTRVSTEAAVTMLGGHAMFLGKDDIQLGVWMPCSELARLPGTDGVCRSTSRFTTRPSSSHP